MLITIGWLATLYAWRQKWLRQQQAWQWWHQKQAVQSHHTAESIRDGLLQQTFAFRRYLETAGTSQSDHASPEQTHQWLARFQTFYQSLETLSDELSPPFIADSLPLALQFTLKNWQATQAQGTPQIQLALPQNWPTDQSAPQQNQSILSIVSALLTLLLPEGHTATQVRLSLSRENRQNTLLLTANYSDRATQKQPELQHLKEIFRGLTAGELEISQETSSTTCHLSWQNDKA